MNRTSRTLDVVSLAALGGLVAYTASVYGALPARMAVHFNLHGEPNGWTDRAVGTWGIDASFLAIWALVRFSPRWLPKTDGWKARAEQSPTAALATLTMLLLVGVGVFTVWNALQLGAPRVPRLVAIDVLLGFYAIALSSLLPRLRRMPIAGVRTPFSLTSDENWHRTSRFGSYASAASGVACIACALAGAPAAGLALFVAGALAPVVYSWVIAYRTPAPRG